MQWRPTKLILDLFCAAPAALEGQMMQLVLKPEEAAVALGISRAKCYALMARGDLPTILVGASRRIPIAALQEWIERQASAMATCA